MKIAYEILICFLYPPITYFESAIKVCRVQDIRLHIRSNHSRRFYLSFHSVVDGLTIYLESPWPGRCLHDQLRRVRPCLATGKADRGAARCGERQVVGAVACQRARVIEIPGGIRSASSPIKRGVGRVTGNVSCGGNDRLRRGKCHFRIPSQRACRRECDPYDRSTSKRKYLG